MDRAAVGGTSTSSSLLNKGNKVQLYLINARLTWAAMLVVMILLPRYGSADTTAVDSPRKIYDFAEYLFNKGGRIN